MPATGQGGTKNGNFPGEDALLQSPAPKTDTSTDLRRHKIGDDRAGKGVNLKSIQDDLINCDFEPDPNIVWLQNPLGTFKGTQAVQFSQVQSIIRERLRELRPDLDYAVVRAGPHHRQNKHDQLGNAIRETSKRTGRPYNATNPADLHITLHAGKKGEKGEEELYLQGHIYLERRQRPDSRDIDYVYLADPSMRKYPEPGEAPASEAWYYTSNTKRKSS